MNLSVTLWLIRDTFRQSLASGVFWLLLGVSGLCVLFCLSVTINAPPNYDPKSLWSHVQDGAVRDDSFFFGAIHQQFFGPRDEEVRKIQFFLGGLGAQTVGLLLVLTFTAGFIPSFVDPNCALILLAKPVPRWQIFLGKFLGVMAFIFVHVVIFIVGTWTALGVATGVWPIEYFAEIPTLILHYGIYFSFSAMMAVTTRNTAACVIGSIIFWLMCWGMNLGRDAILAYDLTQFSVVSRIFTEAGYWILPKPADQCASTWLTLNPEPLSVYITDFAKVQDKGGFWPILSKFSSLAFAAVIVALSARELDTTDY